MSSQEPSPHRVPLPSIAPNPHQREIGISTGVRGGHARRAIRASIVHDNNFIGLKAPLAIREEPIQESRQSPLLIKRWNDNGDVRIVPSSQAHGGAFGCWFGVYSDRSARFYAAHRSIPRRLMPQTVDTGHYHELRRRINNGTGEGTVRSYKVTRVPGGSGRRGRRLFFTVTVIGEVLSCC